MAFATISAIMGGETGERRSLGRRAAQARRDYWRAQYEQALAVGDKEAAANALRFVQEYDAFMDLMKCKEDALTEPEASRRQ